MCKKREKAYMTVEASMIFPVLLGGIILVIYLGLCLYDACVMKQICYISALRGSQLMNVSSKEVERYVKEELEGLINSKMLIKENMEKEVEVSFGNVKVKLSKNFEVPWVKNVFSKIGLWKIEKEARIRRYHPVDYIRKVRKENEGWISE